MLFDLPLHLPVKFTDCHYVHLWAACYGIDECLKFAAIFCLNSLKLFCLQGRCIGQGTYSDLANSGLDVQSLVSLPESDDDSIIEADDIKVKEKKEDNNTQSTALKAKVKTIVFNSLLLITKR